MLEDVVLPIIAILSVFVFCPLAIAYSVRLVRGRSEPQNSIANDELSHRMIEMQRSIDAMAVEIERISEGQRFVTKVLADRPAASAGELSAPKKAVPARRGP
jgi:hypothetical protein